MFFSGKINPILRHDGLPFTRRQLLPCARLQAVQRQIPYPDTQEPERRKTRGRGHAPHLAVFALHQRELQPCGRNIGPEADGRFPRRDVRFSGNEARAARQGAVVPDEDAAAFQRE